MPWLQCCWHRVRCHQLFTSGARSVQSLHVALPSSPSSSPPTEAIRSRSQHWAWTAYPHLSFSPLDHRNPNLRFNSLISCHSDWLPPQPMKRWGWPMKDGTLHIKFCCELGGASAPMMTQEECALSRPSRVVGRAARFWDWWWHFIEYLLYFYFPLPFIWSSWTVIYLFLMFLGASWDAYTWMLIWTWNSEISILFLISQSNIMSYGPDEVSFDWIEA